MWPERNEGVPGADWIPGSGGNGGFYVLGVLPSDYDLAVDPQALMALSARAASVPVSVGPRGAPTVRIVVVQR